MTKRDRHVTYSPWVLGSGAGDGRGRDLYDDVVRLLRPRQAAARDARRCVPRNRCRRRAGASTGDGEPRRRPLDGAADLHQWQPCRRLRGPPGARRRRQADAAAGWCAVSRPFTAACIQLTAGPDLAPNIAVAAERIRAAQALGAELVLTPENTTMIEPRRPLLLEKALPEARHPAIPAFAELAAELGIWLLIGSLAIKVEAARCANRSYLFDPKGRVAARYDKIHMFDVDLASGERYRESASFRPGSAAMISDLPWGRLGLTICYDLRFPALYRALAHAGAAFISVPSAFARPTGEAHWQVLAPGPPLPSRCLHPSPARRRPAVPRPQTQGPSLR